MPRIIPIEDLSGSANPGAGSGVQSTFVYRPGASPSNNVYSSWISLTLDLALQNGQKTVQIDDSIVSPAIIPLGTYDLKDTILVGNSEIRNVPPVLSFDDGASFLNLKEFNFLELKGNSTTPILISSSADQLIFRDSIVSVNTGKAPLVSSSATLDVILDRTSFVGLENIISVSSGTTTLWLENQSSIVADIINSSNISTVDFNLVDSNVSLAAQPNILGTTSTLSLEEADKVFYNNIGSGLTSTDVQGAIDELASGGGNTLQNSYDGGNTIVTTALSGNVDISGTEAINLSVGTGKDISLTTPSDGTVILDGVRYYGTSPSDPLAVIGGFVEGDKYYNSTLHMEMRYDALRAKWLSVESIMVQVGRNGNVGLGQYYRGVDGRVLSATIGYPALFNGTVVGFGYTRGNALSATFEIVEGGLLLASIGPTISTTGTNTVLNADFTAAGILALRNSAVGNLTRHVQAWIKLKWRA